MILKGVISFQKLDDVNQKKFTVLKPTDKEFEQGDISISLKNVKVKNSE